MNAKTYVRYYIILSIIAGFFLTIILFFEMSPSTSIKPFYNKLYLLSGFILACIFGLSCAWFPGWYRQVIMKDIQKTTYDSSLKKKRKRAGHHPDCQTFQLHIIRIKNKSYCAGCFGLSIGFEISIIFSIFYILYSKVYLSSFLLIIYIISLTIIGLNFIETIHNFSKTIHILSNSFFIISLFLIIFSIFELTEEIQYGIIALLFSLLFIETRIHLSKKKHKELCSICKNNCKMY